MSEAVQIKEGICLERISYGRNNFQFIKRPRRLCNHYELAKLVLCL